MLSNIGLLDIAQYRVCSAVVESRSCLTRKATEVIAFDHVRFRRNLVNPVSHLLPFGHVQKRGDIIVSSFGIKQSVTDKIDEFVQLSFNIVRCDGITIKNRAENENREP
jgi:hypothetical protein